MSVKEVIVARGDRDAPWPCGACAIEGVAFVEAPAQTCMQRCSAQESVSVRLLAPPAMGCSNREATSLPVCENQRRQHQGAGRPDKSPNVQIYAPAPRAVVARGCFGIVRSCHTLHPALGACGASALHVCYAGKRAAHVMNVPARVRVRTHSAAWGPQSQRSTGMTSGIWLELKRTLRRLWSREPLRVGGIARQGWVGGWVRGGTSAG